MSSIAKQITVPAPPAISSPIDFALRAKNVIENYIRSAILIDDDWPEYGNRTEIIASVNSDREVEKEAELNLTEESDEDVEPNILELGRVRSVNGKAGTYEDAQRLLKIQDSFTKKGVICTGFKYTAKEKERAPKLAKNADIVILDWNFAGDSGAGAVGILKELKDEQLRFICVFTDQEDLLSIKKRILEEVCGSPLPDGKATDFKADNFVFTLRNKAVKNAVSPNQSLEENLFDDAVAHLSKHYRGFLQLGMLEMASRHRSTLLTHLARFSPEFDAALLAESALEHSPVDMASNLRALLVDEWRIALESSAQDEEMWILGKEGRAAYAAGLKQNCSKITPDFLDACASALGVPFKRGEMDTFFAVPKGQVQRTFDSRIGAWLDAGAVERAPSSRDLKGKEAAKMTMATLYALSHSGDIRKEPLQEEIYKYVFRLDALFNQQLLLPEDLTQGTILKYDAENYLICITPLCDTARLSKGFHAYSFLGATKAKSNEMLGPKTDYCVFMEDDEPVCLHVDIKRPYVYEVGQDARKIALAKSVAMRPRLLPPGKPLPALEARKGEDCSIQEKTSEATVKEPLAVPAAVCGKESEACVTTASGPDIADGTFSVTVVGQLRTDFFLMLTAASASNATRVGVNRMEFIRSHKSKT